MLVSASFVCCLCLSSMGERESDSIDCSRHFYFLPSLLFFSFFFFVCSYISLSTGPMPGVVFFLLFALLSSVNSSFLCALFCFACASSAYFGCLRRVVFPVQKESVHLRHLIPAVLPHSDHLASHSSEHLSFGVRISYFVFFTYFVLLFFLRYVLLFFIRRIRREK